ncbi:hypothetical protein C8J56DRAFT_1020735 [Mycena floridula]|nr:hypothetical protein C8J56DRAFT_1020735 [Mycena floridula]
MPQRDSRSVDASPRRPSKVTEHGKSDLLESAAVDTFPPRLPYELKIQTWPKRFEPRATPLPKSRASPVASLNSSVTSDNETLVEPSLASMDDSRNGRCRVQRQPSAGFTSRAKSSERDIESRRSSRTPNRRDYGHPSRAKSCDPDSASDRSRKHLSNSTLRESALMNRARSLERDLRWKEPPRSRKSSSTRSREASDKTELRRFAAPVPLMPQLMPIVWNQPSPFAPSPSTGPSKSRRILQRPPSLNSIPPLSPRPIPPPAFQDLPRKTSQVPVKLTCSALYSPDSDGLPYPNWSKLPNPRQARSRRSAIPLLPNPAPRKGSYSKSYSERSCQIHEGINFGCKECNPTGEPMRFPF